MQSFEGELDDCLLTGNEPKRHSLRSGESAFFLRRDSVAEQREKQKPTENRGPIKTVLPPDSWPLQLIDGTLSCFHADKCCVSTLRLKTHSHIPPSSSCTKIHQQQQHLLQLHPKTDPSAARKALALSQWGLNMGPTGNEPPETAQFPIGLVEWAPLYKQLPVTTAVMRAEAARVVGVRAMNTGLYATAEHGEIEGASRDANNSGQVLREATLRESDVLDTLLGCNGKVVTGWTFPVASASLCFLCWIFVQNRYQVSALLPIMQHPSSDLMWTFTTLTAVVFCPVLLKALAIAPPASKATWTPARSPPTSRISWQLQKEDLTS